MTDTVTAPANEEKRTRYTGPVEMTTFETIEVDNSVLARKRETVDLTPYEKQLKENLAKNRNRTDGKTAAFPFQINDAALSTAKSRFQQAGRNVNIGVTFTTYAAGTHKLGTQSVTVPKGHTLVLVSTGKRITGRGRKPKAQ